MGNYSLSKGEGGEKGKFFCSVHYRQLFMSNPEAINYSRADAPKRETSKTSLKSSAEIENGTKKPEEQEPRKTSSSEQVQVLAEEVAECGDEEVNKVTREETQKQNDDSEGKRTSVVEVIVEDNVESGGDPYEGDISTYVVVESPEEEMARERKTDASEDAITTAEETYQREGDVREEEEEEVRSEHELQSDDDVSNSCGIEVDQECTPRIQDSTTEQSMDNDWTAETLPATPTRCDRVTEPLPVDQEIPPQPSHTDQLTNETNMTEDSTARTAHDTEDNMTKLLVLVKEDTPQQHDSEVVQTTCKTDLMTETIYSPIQDHSSVNSVALGSEIVTDRSELKQVTEKTDITTIKTPEQEKRVISVVSSFRT